MVKIADSAVIRQAIATTPREGCRQTGSLSTRSTGMVAMNSSLATQKANRDLQGASDPTTAAGLQRPDQRRSCSAVVEIAWTTQASRHPRGLVLPLPPGN